MLIAAGVLIWDVARSGNAASPSPAAPAVPANPVSISGAASLGDSAAKVVVIEFSDFQCPYCRQFASRVFPMLKAQYVDTGTVQFVFRHMPLSGIHAQAFHAAEAAECAARQGLFWPVHDRLFKSPALEDADLRGAARAAGVDMRVFEACLQGAAAEQIRSDVALAQALKVNGTPTFMIGVREGPSSVRVHDVAPGAGSIEALAKIIDPLVTDAK
jgi:protein-disulfide isomerase